jgi:hypothetical protein
MPEGDFRIRNYSVAAGRIGVAVIVPLLWAEAFVLIFWEMPVKSPAFGFFLFAVGVVLAWMAVRSPLWVAVNADRFLVRYPLGTRTFDIKDVVRVESGRMVSTIGGLGTRRYPAATFILKSGRSIRIKADSHAVAAIQSRLGRAEPRS